jgi:alcohol dehydrogenase
MGKRVMTISLIPDIAFGAGCMGNVGKKSKALFMKKPLIVCDPAMGRLGLTQRVEDSLSESGLDFAIFDECVENPTEKEVSEATAAYEGAGCDGLIALGGGSVIDVAKGTRVVAKHGGSVIDYDVHKGGIKKIGRDLQPMIAIPTTAGTGSEASLGTVIIDSTRSIKVIIFSPHLMVSCAMLDPELTLSMSPILTAGTGFDALVHALEAYVVNTYNPMADGFCRTVFELVGKSLGKAVADGNDLEARTDMLMASLLAGMAFAQKGLGAVHALSHQLSSRFGVAHGTANAMMLAHVMKFNGDAVGTRYVEAVGLMGLEMESADQAADAMIQFSKELGLPGRLSEVGITEDELPQMAEQALGDVALFGNPVKCSQEDALELYKRAM